MKIVDREDFMEMEPPLLFAKFEPCRFGDLSIKYKNAGENDYYQNALNSSIKAESSGEWTQKLFDLVEGEIDSVQIDLEQCGRDGLFDDDQLFAVWEKQDIDELIYELEVIRDNMEDS